MTEFPMDPERLAEEIEIPLSEWPGNCHGVATAVLRHAPVAGMRLVRGHWHGYVSRGSVYRGSPCQHSWLVLEDGRILDPTRWAMERPDAPAIYVGENDHYDEAGLEIASRIPAPFPGIKTGFEGALSRAQEGALARIATALGREAPTDRNPDGPAMERLAASLHSALRDDPDALPDASELYGALEAAGLRALIRIDLWMRVMEPERLRPRPGANRLFDAPLAEALTEAQVLLRILSRFLSIEERGIEIEEELEELGYELDDLHRALNRLDDATTHGHITLVEQMPRRCADDLAVIAGDLLGRGFGTSLRVERHAASLGLDRRGLDALLRRLGERAGYTLAWL